MRLKLAVAVFLLILSIPIKSMAIDAPTEVEADLLAYDHDKDAALAKGKVKIIQGKETVFADEAIYLRKDNKLYAKGNVKLLKEDGSIYYADVVNLDHKLQKGRLLSFKSRIGKKGLFSSHAAEMKDKKHMRLHSIVFSPCSVCKNNLRPFLPLWQIRASEANIDLEKERVHYKNARIEAYGVPVFYTPYFSTPTPNAKRKSGVLPPILTGSTTNGGAVKIPLYLNIASNKDFTYSPSISQNKKRPIIHELEFRHMLPNGSYTLSGSIAHGEKLDKDRKKLKGKYTYGHIDSFGNFTQKEGIASGDYGFEVKRVKDPSLTYTKVYNILPDDILTSRLYHTKTKENYYVDSQAVLFQDLRPGFYDSTTPHALPLINVEHHKKLDNIDALVATRMNLLHISRAQGNSYKRTSAQTEIKKKVEMESGHIIELSMKGRADGYSITEKKIKSHHNNTSYKSVKKGEHARFSPQLKGKVSYPVIKTGKTYSILLEPTAQIIASPKIKQNKKIPNEDSQIFEISASNLFSDNRYGGLDVIEGGNRANYGINGYLDNSILDKIHFLVGQSYSFNKPEYKEDSGLQDKFSDYVGQFEYGLSEKLSILHRIRVDKQSLNPNRNELSLSYQGKKYIFSMDYSFASKKVVNNNTNIFRQEISAYSGYNFYDAWWITAKIRGNLGRKPLGVTRSIISSGLGLNYYGECLSIGLEAQREYTMIKNLKPRTTYLLKISIPTF
jgi:LPS-assembly protein